MYKYMQTQSLSSLQSLKVGLCFTNTYKFKNYSNNSSFKKLDLITRSPSRKNFFQSTITSHSFLNIQPVFCSIT